MGLFKGDKNFRWLFQPSIRCGYVELHHFLTRNASDIFYGSCNSNRFAVPVDATNGNLKVRIAKSMTEAIRRLFFKSIKIPIAYIDILFIIQVDTIIFLARQFIFFSKIDEVLCGRVVVVINSKGIWQFTAGVCSAIENLHQCIARSLACKTCVDDCIDTVFLNPAHFNRISGI